MSANTKFAKQSIMGKPPSSSITKLYVVTPIPKSTVFPKVGESFTLSKPVTSNSIPTAQESKDVKNDKVTTPRMFRINPFKTSKEEKYVPNKVRASARTNTITVSQPSVITKKVVNSDSNCLSSTGVDNTKTRRPQPRSNTKHDRVPSTSKSSQIKNKDAEVEEHHRNLLLSKNNKHMSSACNNIKLDSQDVISKVVCAKCNKCLISVNHDKCLCTYVNDKNSCGKKQKAKVSIKEIQKKYQPTVKKPKKWGNILITRVYFVEGLGYNLFSIGQFYDSDLEVAFRRDVCFVKNLEGVDLLKRDRSTNLYTINLNEMASASPICLMARAVYDTHRSAEVHENFDDNEIFNMFTQEKQYTELLEPIPESHKVPQNDNNVISEDTSMEQGGKIVEQHTTNFEETRALYESLYQNLAIESSGTKKSDISRISHQVSSVRTPQQNGVVRRRNRTLVEAARTILIFSRALLFLWAEAIATACFTQNCSIIHHQFNKRPYELINNRKLNIPFLHVFEDLCYPKNDREDNGKLGAKGDISFFIGYSTDSSAYKVYNRRTKKIIETMNVTFDELSVMDFEQSSSKPGLQSMTSGQISLGLDLTYASSTISTQQPTKGELDLLFEAMCNDYIGGHPSASPRTALASQVPQVLQSPTTSTSIADTALTPSNSSSQATNFPNSSQNVDGLKTQQQHAQQQEYQAPLQPETVADNVPNDMFNGNLFVNPFATLSSSAAESSSL
nr:hypothetical protein [Tanacetum cinerariifolium]